MAEVNDSTADFNIEEYNGFFYTNDKQIKKMDDELVIAKIVEKYPEFANKRDENLIKSVFSVIANDTKFINEVMEELDMTAIDIFSTIYRHYSFIFNTSFTTKIQRIISRKSYARISKRRK